MPPPIPWEDAQRRLIAMAPAVVAQGVTIEQAVGRYLAEPLVARRTQPATDLSAMDGYAMDESDTAGPWRVIGESAAGHPFPGTIASGQAVRISTGAPMPPGAGAVLLQEEAVRDGADLSLAPGGEATPRHVRRQGRDFRERDMLLPAGTRIGPAQLALAITGGVPQLAVGRRPVVSIIDSGDELAADPAHCPPHAIPASNGAMLAAMAAPFAAGVNRLGPVADDADDLRAALDACGPADVIVTSGGASVGDHDLVRPALMEWGAEIAFWRIAIKPGKPLLVARRGRQIVLGLPGNPVSSYVTAFLFLLPLLRAMGGSASPFPTAVHLPLDGELPPAGNRVEFLRAHHDGHSVRAIGQQDSSMLHALAASNALIRRDIAAPAAAAGSIVSAYLLENGAIA